MISTDKILILDFGSQYTQLIARRIREANVYCQIQPYNFSIENIKEFCPKGIIISGGPMSVYDDDAPQIAPEIFSLNIPILGICYGLQLIAKNFGGCVEPAKSREYGKANIQLLSYSEILQDVKNNTFVWMSHGDFITKLPEEFVICAKSANSPICAISNSVKKIYGLQFHPEVVHTEEGSKIIRNFVFNICGCDAVWAPENFIEMSVKEIRETVGNKYAICALSGGVDSSVAALLLHKAIGSHLICIHVDNGLMRKNESADVIRMFEENFDLNVKLVDASEEFLSRLNGVSNPEQKRKIIGNTFIEVFEREAKLYSDVEFLVQGTLYPDVIESVPIKGLSVTIKSHHNVGGLPEKMNLKLIEPFRELFKDEVRKIGYQLKLPKNFIERHPFPGPGLAVRILGNITEERLTILNEADKIFIELLYEYDLYDKIWQAFTVLLPIQTVGVMGDQRTYEYVLALRAVNSTDGMTSDWFRFDSEFLEIASNKIIREVKGVNRIVYDISSKPPSTIEWE